jgi:hypothetical protein
VHLRIAVKRAFADGTLAVQDRARLSIPRQATSGLELFTAVELPLEVVQQAEIKVCRNAACHTGKFSVDSGIGKDGRAIPKRTTARIILSGEPERAEIISAEVVSTNRPHTIALSVAWHWEWSTTPNARHDKYDISIEADGTTLYSTHRVVEEYNVFQPNGADPPCGGLTCGQASSVDEQLLEEVRQKRDADALECNDRDAGPAAC